MRVKKYVEKCLLKMILTEDDVLMRERGVKTLIKISVRDL